MKTIMLCILILSLIVSCNENSYYEQFSSKRMNYNGSDIKTNGYFFNSYLSGQDSVFRLLILYQNGIAIRTVTYDKLEKFEEVFNNGEFNRSIEKVEFEWGLFNIENDSIFVEHHYPEGGIRAYTYIRSGKILNDTTFHLTLFSRPDGSELESIDQVYHFKQFSPKPDSTNNFIK